MYSLTALFWDSKTHDIHAKEWMEEDNGKVDLQAFGIEEGAVEKAVARSAPSWKSDENMQETN